MIPDPVDNLIGYSQANINCSEDCQSKFREL